MAARTQVQEISWVQELKQSKTPREVWFTDSVGKVKSGKVHNVTDGGLAMVDASTIPAGDLYPDEEAARSASAPKGK